MGHDVGGSCGDDGDDDDNNDGLLSYRLSEEWIINGYILIY